MRTGEPVDSSHIFYNGEAELQSKAQTFDFLKTYKNVGNVAWQNLRPDARHTWLTEGLHADFNDLIPMGTKEAKRKKGTVEGVIFKVFSLGVSTNRDVWVYNFDQDALRDNLQRTIATYTAEMDRWKRQVSEWKRGNVPEPIVDNFVLYDDTKIKWSRDLKKKLTRGTIAEYANEKIRTSLYRPFTKSNLYLDRTMTDIVSLFPSIFPTPEAEMENRVICVNVTPEKPFTCLITNHIPNLVVTGGYGSPTQCFPFCTYGEDGKIRRENITDWALERFQNHYENEQDYQVGHLLLSLRHFCTTPIIAKSIRKTLSAASRVSLLPRDFWGFAKAGKQLAELHVNYEAVPKYAGLTLREAQNMPLDLRVEKMKFSKDKTQIRYNDFLTIEDIPAEAHDYRLGTRSALEWIVDQYRVTEDYKPNTGRGSRIINDPNRETEPRYIVDLIARVVTVSLETMEIIKNLPALYFDDEN